MYFELGQLFVTRGINEKVLKNERFAVEITAALSRYMKNDWGKICAEDKACNDHAVKHGDRILGAYETCEGDIWIITEWDRSATTILLPEEY